MDYNKPRIATIGTAVISADATEDGRVIIIKVKLPERLKSFEQLKHLLHIFLSKAEFKLVDKNSETPIQ
jgi:hypothetical protein